MLEPLWGFLAWVVSAGLLLLALILGKNGNPAAAGAVIAVLVGWMYFVNKVLSGKSTRIDGMSKINERPVVPPRRKIEFNILNTVFTGLWVVAICIGVGIFGKSQYLSYVAGACAIAGLAIIFFQHFRSR